MSFVYENNWGKRRLYYLACTAKGLTVIYYLSMLQTLIRTSNDGPQCLWGEPFANLARINQQIRVSGYHFIHLLSLQSFLHYDLSIVIVN